MLNLNTNLQSLLIRKSLQNSTNILNQAIERMSTGMKINSAKDNAANYAISTQMTTQLSALDVSEDNTSMGLDLLMTANDTLDLINSRFTRLRDLAMQAENKTYGEESLKAINVECESLVEEIKTLTRQAEFEGMKIYGAEILETIQTNATDPIQVLSPDPTPLQTYATAQTTLQELGIDESSFQIYNSEGRLIESYDTEKGDTLQDVFDVLSTYGFTSSITDGVVSISSGNGRYVDGDLMHALGIELDATDFVESSKQNSNSIIYYTTAVTATESSTLAEISVLSSGTDTIVINNKYGDLIEEITVSSSTTFGGLFNQLSNYDIQGSIDEGIVSLSSSNGNYLVSQGVVANMGISAVQSSSIVTTGTTQTSDGAITYETITATGGEVTTIQQEQTVTIWTTTTTSETVTSTIWTTTTTSETVTSTIWTTTTTSETLTETIWTTTTTSETLTETIWTTTTTSETLTETIWTTTTTSETQTETITTTTSFSTSQSGVLIVTQNIEGTESVESNYSEEEIATMTAIQTVSSFTSGQTYKIETAADLAYLATKVNAGTSHDGAIFVLANDIDLSEYLNWSPIGDSSYNPFEGSFDGNGHVISNLTIDYNENFILGLFGYVGMSYIGETITIQNTGLENISINGGSNIGGLIGCLDSYGTVTILNNYVTGNIVGVGDYIGGLIGKISSNCTLTISNNYSFSTVSGGNFVGGLIGTFDNDGSISEVLNNFSNGAVSGLSEVGGFAGCINNSRMEYIFENNYTNSTVRGTDYVGGFAGYTYNYLGIITFENNYANSSVFGEELVGGFFGDFGDVGDSVTTDLSSNVSTQGDLNVTQVTIDELRSNYTPDSMGYTEANGWQIVDDTPVLAWQTKMYSSVSLDTKLSDLGYTDTVMLYFTAPDDMLTYDNFYANIPLECPSCELDIQYVGIDPNATLGQFVDFINCFGYIENEVENPLFNATFENGVLSIVSAENCLIDTDPTNSTLFSILNFTTKNEEEVNTSEDIITVYTTTTTSTTETNTIWITTTASETLTNTIWTTTTSSTTETETIWTTTTASETQTNTIWSTTTNSATETETVWSTTTSSETRTEMVDVYITTSAIYTTANLAMTSDNTFTELGLTSRGYITVMNDDTKTIITIKTADTVQDMINRLSQAGISSSINDGILTLTPNAKSIYISGMSDNMINLLQFTSDFYSTSLGVDITDSNILVNDNAQITINNSTTLSQIGVTTGELVVKKDGNDEATIAVSESQSIGDLLTQLQNAGFSASCSNGALKLNSSGDRYLASASTNSSNAVDVFGLGSVEQTIDSTYSNTDSDQLEKLSEIVDYVWHASSALTLQVGTNNDEHSRLEISTGFDLGNVDRFKNIGKNMVSKVNYVEELDKIIANISMKQVEIGASENRLESVLDEISIKYDNLVSSRSTIRDADLAEESSRYIQSQILQQASATLLSVANQSPQLALQLL